MKLETYRILLGVAEGKLSPEKALALIVDRNKTKCIPKAADIEWSREGEQAYTESGNTHLGMDTVHWKCKLGVPFY